MPQILKPPRLYLRKRPNRSPTWVARYRGDEVSTGCSCFGKAYKKVPWFFGDRGFRDEGAGREAIAMVRRARERAAKRGERFDLTPEDILDVMRGQKFRCALSGVPFSLDKAQTGRRRPNAPSLDRIDCSIGYTRDNVRITTVMVNLARQDFPDVDFVRMCQAVTLHCT